MLQRLQREFFILFPCRDKSSPPGTARGWGFNFTFTCQSMKESVNHHINPSTDLQSSTVINTHLEAVHAWPGLRGDGRGRWEGQWWGGRRGGGNGRWSKGQGVDSDGGHVVGVLVLSSAGKGELRTRCQDGDHRLRTEKTTGAVMSSTTHYDIV